MLAHKLTPILNVSNITESFRWFEKLGWKKGWEWGAPPMFGGVCSGVCEIFLCQGAQGGRGSGGVKMTFGPDGDETADKGVWMSIWVEDVDAIHRHCVEQGLDVAWPPTDMPWGVREMHVRHPDGHVFRISKGTGGTDEPRGPRRT
jgi:predicted enzyme related to lactoylglutathione lyase